MIKFFLILSCIYSIISFARPVRIVALGDSLTEGYGVSKEKAYPAILQKKLKKIHSQVKVINAGIAGATTASALSSLKWQLRRPFDILLLCLGANDGLRGLKVKASKENLRKAISLARKKKIKVILIGMKIPLNYGKQYRSDFEKMYKNLVKEEKLHFIPFLLKDVAGEKKYNLSDGIHPNEQGYEKVAENVFQGIKGIL